MTGDWKYRGLNRCEQRGALAFAEHVRRQRVLGAIEPDDDLRFRPIDCAGLMRPSSRARPHGSDAAAGAALAIWREEAGPLSASVATTDAVC